MYHQTLTRGSGLRAVILQSKTARTSLGLVLALTVGASALTAQSRDQEVVELEQFEVRALAEGQRRALTEQRDSANLVNVISADALGRFPDPNIAEALQRLPGIGIERDQGEGRYINIRGAPKEFASVTIDGISIPASDVATRAVDLDVFASDFVDQISVTKAVRPDQDADAIAGTVDIRTPSALATGHRRILGTVATSYNSMGSTNDSRFNFLYSDVFGANKNVGLILGYNYSKTRREVDNVEHEGWDQINANGRDVWIFAETNFKDYETRRTREGFNAALEWAPSETSSFFVRGFTSKFEDDEFRYRLRIHWEDGTPDLATIEDGFATWARPRVSYQFRERIKVDESTSLSFGGKHDFDGVEWDYTAAFSTAEQYYPRRDEMLFRIRPARISYDFRNNPRLPEISLFQTNEHLNTDAYAFREYSRRTLEGEENETALSTNLTWHGELFDAPARHRFGLKLRDRDKFYDFDRFRDRRAASGPGVPLTAFLSDRQAVNYNYLLGQKHEPRRVQDYFDSARPNAPQRRVDDGILSDYQVDEEISAAYAMSQFTFGATDFIAGLRVERTRTAATGFTLDRSTGAIGTQRISTDRTHWFPGLHARMELSPEWVLRASATRGIGRPPMAAIAPFRDENPDSRTVSQGNPNLKPTLSNNLDLSLEFYPAVGGLVSAGVFYKDLTDYVVRSRFNADLVVDGETRSYRFTQPLNAPEGEILGAEVNYQQTFSFLPGALSGLGVFANYTLTSSEALLPDRSGKVALPGQSKHTANLGFFYETKRLSAQVSYSQRSDYIQSLDTINGRDYDVYWSGVGQVDLTTSYKVSRNFQVFAEFTNITEGKGLRYVGSKERVLEYEQFGWWVTFGTRFNF